MHDIFKLQDEIVQNLVTTLGLQISMFEQGIVVPQRTNNLEAYDYYLRSLEAVLTNTPEGFAEARKMDEKAVTLDPGYAAHTQMQHRVPAHWQGPREQHFLAVLRKAGLK